MRQCLPLAKAFHLDKGKKILQLAKDNAEKRSSQSCIMERISGKLEWFESNACTSLKDMELPSLNQSCRYGALILGGKP